jgi:hypothetical protein
VYDYFHLFSFHDFSCSIFIFWIGVSPYTSCVLGLYPCPFKEIQLFIKKKSPSFLSFVNNFHKVIRNKNKKIEKEISGSYNENLWPRYAR